MLAVSVRETANTSAPDDCSVAEDFCNLRVFDEKFLAKRIQTDLHISPLVLAAVSVRHKNDHYSGTASSVGFDLLNGEVKLLFVASP